MQKKIKRAGGLIVLSYLLSQGIRLVANLIVARLLAPEMFGVMAVVLMVQQGIAMFSDVGINAYVLRHKNYRDQTLLNTVWTIQVVRGWWMCFVVFSFGAGLWYLQQKAMTSNWGVLDGRELPALIAVMSLTSILSGYQSLAQFVYGRELNRLRIELAQLLAQLGGTAVMIGWAWYAPSIWALASAGVVSSLLSLWLSYQMFEIRHRIQWDKKTVSELYHFGKWIFLATALTYLAQQGDRLFLSVNVSASELGLYSIALMFATFATSIVNRFTDQLWLPVFSQKAFDVKSLKRSYYRVRLIQDGIVGLFVLFAGFLSPYFINIFYDDRYQGVAWMLQLLLLSVVALSVASTAKSLLVSTGHTRVQMQVMVVKLAALLSFVPGLFSLYGIKGIIAAMVISNFLGLIPQYLKIAQNDMLSVMHEVRVLPFIVLLYVVGIGQQ